MHLLRCFLGAIVVQLVLRPGFAKEAHLRQVHVNVECDDGLGSPCGDVHTLMLPQHGASVSEQVSQKSWLQGKVGSTLQSTLHSLAKRSSGNTVLWLGVFICLGCVLFNTLSSGEPSPDEERREAEPDDRGSWGQAYREARGPRRDAMELLFNTGIIPREDLALHDVHGTHIEECVQVAAHMLKEKPMDEWVISYKQAQHTFEERYSMLERTSVRATHDIMAEFEFCDGSWARAYLQSAGQRDRKDAFQLLLRLGIVSKGEFADSLVSPPYIEERVSVAMSLLKRQSLGKWMAICETAQGSHAKASVLAQFASGGHSEPGAVSTTATTPSAGATPEVPQDVTISPTNRRDFRRGATQGTYHDEQMVDVGHTPAGISTFTSSEAGGAKLYHKHVDAEYVDLPASVPVAPMSSTSPRSTGSPCFVLPRSGNTTPTETTRSLPPTAFRSPDMSQRLPTPERPRSLNWPASGSLGSGRRQLTPPSSATGSQGWPAQIKFANNAISGSSWQTTVTPPGSMRNLPK